MTTEPIFEFIPLTLRLDDGEVQFKRGRNGAASIRVATDETDSVLHFLSADDLLVLRDWLTAHLDRGVWLNNYDTHPGWLHLAGKSFPMPTLADPPHLTPKEESR